MSLKPNYAAEKVFASMSESNFSLNTKIAILSFHKIEYSKYIEILIVICEYFQLISQLILIALELAEQPIESEKPLLKGIRIICQVFNPFYSDKNQAEINYHFLKVIFTLACCYIVLKHTLFVYIIGNILHKLKNYDSLKILWKWIFKLQSRVICFIFSSYWFELIKASSKNDFNMFELERTSIIIISCVMIAIEYIESFYLLTNYCSILPTKNFLAEKGSYIQVITLTQKLLLQVGQFCISINSKIFPWIFPLFCLIIDLFRNLYFFKKLPLYRIEALFFQCNFLMIATSLSISWFLQIFIKYTLDYNISALVWVMWTILIIFTIKNSELYLKRVIFGIVTSCKKFSPEIMIHKVSFINQLLKERNILNQQNQSYFFYFLIRETIKKKMKTILSLSSELGEDINSKESINRMFLHYLESLLIQFPESKIIKLYFAYFCAKKMKLFAKAVKLAKELQRSYGRITSLNTSILIFDIQNIINSKYGGPNSMINLSQYIKSQASFAQLKNKIYDRIQLQIKLYREIQTDAPRVLEIINLPQEVYSYQRRIENQIQVMLDIIPDFFIEPLAFLAHYYFMVNHSASEALKYRKIYFKKFAKYQRYFNHETFQQENIYQRDSAFLIFSGSKKDAGKILFCTKSIESITGKEARSLIGKSVAALNVPSLQYDKNITLKHAMEDENLSFLNKINRSFNEHYEGYMVENEHYTAIFPILNERFCYISIIRRARTTRDCLLVNKNGDIEAATKNIQEKLGLRKLRQTESKANPNIKLLSKELEIVNKELNEECFSNKTNDGKDTVRFQKTNSNIDRDKEEIEKVKLICSIYKTEGKEIELNSLVTEVSHLYHCRLLEVIPETFQKIFALQKVDNDRRKERVKNTSPRVQKAMSKKFVRDSLDTDKKLPNFEDGTLYHNGNLSLMTRRIQTKKNLISENSECVEFSEKNQPEVHNTQSPVDLIKDPELLSERPLLRTLIDQGYQKASKTYQSNQEISSERFTQLHQRRWQKAKESVTESVNGKQTKLSNASKILLDSKAYSRSSLMFCFIFYLILASIFGIQFFIKETWRNHISALKAKKDILNNALLRNFFISDLPAYFTTLVCVENGKIDTGPLNMGPEVLLFGIEAEISSLREVNNILLSDTNSLSEGMRENLFYKDVRVFELCPDCPVQSFIKLDNFQATNVAIDAMLNLIPIAKENVTNAYDKIDLLSRNCYNDLSLKNVEIAEIFLNSLNDQREEIVSIMRMFEIIILTLVLLNVIFMSIDIWRHYFIQIQQISAVIRLNSAGVNTLLNRFENFKEMIENQFYFEKNITTNRFAEIKSSDDYTPITRKIKKDLLKALNTKGLVRKYYLYVLKLTTSMVILSGLSFWSTKVVDDFVKNLYEKQSQLYLINSARSRVTFASHVITELLFRGANRTIENIPILPFISNSLVEIIELRTRISDTFLLEKDSSIQRIIFGDGCEILGNEFIMFCSLIKAHGVVPSYLQVLNYIENYLTGFHDTFIRLNESEQAQVKQESEDFVLFIAYFAILTSGESFHLIDKIDNGYETLLQESKSQRDIFIIVTTSLGITTVLFWMYALKELKDVDKKFKRVLQMFPIRLVLSNFYLKSYIIKTSKGSSDFIKNQVENN